MSAVPKRVERVVRERSAGHCEGCGLNRPTQLHHRRYRSRGGKHTVSNLLALCGSGNHTGCHGRAHSGEGQELGWSVESGPTATSEYEVTLALHGRVRLVDDGAVVPVGAGKVW